MAEAATDAAMDPVLKHYSAMDATRKADKALFEQHGYWTNGLGVESMAPLWWYDQRDKYKDWDWAMCIGNEFSDEEQAANVAQIRMLMEKIKPQEEQWNDPTKPDELQSRPPLMSGVTPDKPKKMELFNTILAMFGNTKTETQIRTQALMSEKLEEFAHLCRAEKLMLPMREIYRASTNAWPMLALQYLQDCTMTNTKSVVAFSVLYPLTDDIYDNQELSLEERTAFGHRLGKRIRGEEVEPTSQREEEIWRMISYIEEESPRDEYPHPYLAMDGLNTAQIDSMKQFVSAEDRAAGNLNMEELWTIITRKGAGSIMSDAALTWKHLPPAMASFSSLFGTITQWLNDAKAIDADLAEGQYGPYVAEWFHFKRPLDELQKAVFCYSHDVFTRQEHLDLFTGDDRRVQFAAMMRAFIMMKLLECVAINQEKFTPDFLVKVERRSPLPLSMLQKIRRHFVERIGQF